MPSDAVLHQAAALCLTYPDDDLQARLSLLREAAPQLREFVDHAALTPVRELAAHYVEVFDPEGLHSLYLSRWTDGGDAGRLGRAAEGVPFEDLYRRHGLEFTGEERPDFLPAVLEYAARTGDTEPLTRHREGLERLRSRLAGLRTPYASVLDAVCAILPTVCTSAPTVRTTPTTVRTTPPTAYIP
ncbi:nitrate reductase molybdenum cofactor assembly chaperone [Streptomyces sp. NPDC096132]|uniref:nitrate reductase molybdenum cofactor assembly chaperone n=1 Tax=Streptomyces sp. NPDC096132 TaxID=3366075 RepID=UPI0037F70989